MNTFFRKIYVKPRVLLPTMEEISLDKLPPNLVLVSLPLMGKTTALYYLALTRKGKYVHAGDFLSILEQYPDEIQLFKLVCIDAIDETDEQTAKQILNALGRLGTNFIISSRVNFNPIIESGLAQATLLPLQAKEIGTLYTKVLKVFPKARNPFAYPLDVISVPFFALYFMLHPKPYETVVKTVINWEKLKGRQGEPDYITNGTYPTLQKLRSS